MGGYISTGCEVAQKQYYFAFPCEHVVEYRPDNTQPNSTELSHFRATCALNPIDHGSMETLSDFLLRQFNIEKTQGYVFTLFYTRDPLLGEQPMLSKLLPGNNLMRLITSSNVRFVFTYGPHLQLHNE